MIVACQLWTGTLNRLTAHKHHKTPCSGDNSSSSSSSSTRRHRNVHHQQYIHPLAASGATVFRCQRATVTLLCVPSSSQHSSADAPDIGSTAVAAESSTSVQHSNANHHHHHQQQQQEHNGLSDMPSNGVQQHQQCCEPQVVQQLLHQQSSPQPQHGQQVECQCQQQLQEQQEQEQPEQQQQQHNGRFSVIEQDGPVWVPQQHASAEEQLYTAHSQPQSSSSTGEQGQVYNQQQEQQSAPVEVDQANTPQQQCANASQQQPLSAQEHMQTPSGQKHSSKQRHKQQRNQQQQQQQQQQPEWQQEVTEDTKDALEAHLLMASNWRALLQPAANTQSLPELLRLLRRAVQLQPAAGTAAAVPPVAVAGLAASQPLYEQQQYSRLLRYVIARASQLLLPTAKSPKAAAAAAAAAAQRQDLLQLLQLLASMEPFLQQRLQQQLQQVPVATVIQQQLLHWRPQVAGQVVVHLALLKPHMQAMPVELQQQLFATALGPACSSSSSSSSSSNQKAQRASKQQQQQQQQQLPTVSAAAETLWAAARLGWEPEQQHLQQAVCAVLLQLPQCSSSQLAMAVWGAAQLGVTGRQLQQWWFACISTQQQTPQQQMRDLLRQQHGEGASAGQINPQQQQQQQQQQQRVSRMVSVALLRYCSHFSAPELVSVTWAAAELQLLSESGLMRALLRGLCQPGMLSQLADEDLSSVLWSLARMHQKRAAALRQERYWQQKRQQQQEQGGDGEQQQQQQQLELYDPELAESIEVQLQQEGEGYKGWQLQQEWHAELDQHWYGADNTQQPQQQQQQPDQAGLPAVDSTMQQQDQQQQQERQQWKQMRQQRSAMHAQQLQQPDLVPPVLVQPLLQAYYTTLPTCSSSSIVRTLWSVSLLRVLPPREWMVGVLQQLQGHFTGARGSDWGVNSTSCMLIALALSRLRYLPDGPWLKAFWMACLPFFSSYHQAQQQQQQGQAGDEANTSSRSSSSSSSSSQFNEYELAVLASSAYDISLLSRPNPKGPWKGQKPPGAWLDALAHTSLGHLSPRQDLRTLLMWGEVMMRFSSMAGEPWPGPGAAWWQGFEAATEPYLQAAEAKELLRLGKMLSTQQQHIPVGVGWVQAFLQASKACCLHTRAITGALGAPGWVRGQYGRRSLKTSPRAAAAAAAAGSVQGHSGAVQSGPQALSARNLANLGKAVAALGVLPDKEWLEAWEVAVELSGAGMTPALVKSLQRTRAAFAQLTKR